MPAHALTQEQFLSKVITIHKGKYDLSKTTYKTGRDRICVICPIHGEFYPRAVKFLEGEGCKKCAHTPKYTVVSFIEKANKVHNNKYDYSNIKSISSIRDSLEIVCPEHGIFYQRLDHHLNGHGCVKCGGRYQLDKEGFIERSRKVHGDKYDYSEVIYENNRSNVTIGCPIHGKFKQIASVHMFGGGCNMCSNNIMTQEQFIEKAKEVHNNKYTYEFVEYKGSDSMISINCPKHGIFIQKAYHHLEKCGCPRCNSSKGELAIIDWLNSNNIQYKHQKKFSDCTDKYVLSFDFCVYNKDKSIKTLIEFDGVQHFRPSTGYFGEHSFMRTVYHDAIKNQYCLDKGIPLLRIPYWDIARVPDILSANLGDKDA